jgi:hypothetical protein
MLLRSSSASITGSCSQIFLSVLLRRQRAVKSDWDNSEEFIYGPILVKFSKNAIEACTEGMSTDTSCQKQIIYALPLPLPFQKHPNDENAGRIELLTSQLQH